MKLISCSPSHSIIQIPGPKDSSNTRPTIVKQSVLVTWKVSLSLSPDELTICSKCAVTWQFCAYKNAINSLATRKRIERALVHSSIWNLMVERGAENTCSELAQ